MLCCIYFFCSATVNKNTNNNKMKTKKMLLLCPVPFPVISGILFAKSLAQLLFKKEAEMCDKK